MSRTFIYLFIFIYFGLTISPCCGFSQQLMYKFKQFTTNEGLPSSEVHQVLKDSRNFMWVATDHGVCRYDGYKFETFNLLDNSILSMYEDVRKRIWFVSFSGRLFYYENGKFNDYKYNNLVIKMTNQVVINRIYVDSLDNVYVSTTDPNCFSINIEGKVNKLFNPERYFSFEAFETESNRFFSYKSSSTYAGMKSFFTVTNYFTKIIIKTKKKDYHLKIFFPIEGRKNGVKRLSSGSLVFYSGATLIRILENGEYFIKKFENEILDVEELDNDRLMVSTIQDGLYILNKNNQDLENYFPGLTVTCIEKDYEGGLWISTTQAGIFYLNSLQIKQFSENRAIFNKKTLCLEINNNDIWVGGESGSIYFFQKDKTVKEFNFPIITVNGIHTEIIPKTIFICAGQFIRKDVDKFLIYKYHGINFNLVQSISNLININGTYFGANPSGLLKLDFIKKRLELQNKKYFRVAAIWKNNSNNLLVGNLFGLWRYTDGDLRPYDSTKKILTSRITDINEFKNKYLCVGTRGNGFLISIDDSLYQLTTENGLASDNIRKIFIDENVIWLATNKGLSRLEIISLNPLKYAIRNISAQEGLLSNEVNDIKRLDSNVIVATNGGISLFNRDLFAKSKPTSLSLYMTRLKINGIDTVINDQYSFNHKYRNLSLSFVALSYRESSNIEYRYRLFGIDSNWINISSREIQLNPIPYGRYSVQIQARRQGEDWHNENSLAVDISRIIPFWKTTWFQSICFLLAALLMLIFFVNRTKKIKQREKERTFLNKKLAEMELKALRAQMNPHFIFNVLNSIQYYITHNKNDEAQHYMSKFAKLVRLTLDNSRSTFISLSDELSLLRLYIDLEKIRFEDRFEYKININDNLDLNAIKIPNMLLQPYVENSIKHGFKDKGMKYFIDISLERENENIVCNIIDNGIGRRKAAFIPGTEKDNHSSTGTIIIKEKIEALKQYYNYNLSSVTEDLKDDKNNPTGTKIILTFPEKADISDII